MAAKEALDVPIETATAEATDHDRQWYVVVISQLGALLGPLITTYQGLYKTVIEYGRMKEAVVVEKNLDITSNKKRKN